MAIGASTRAHSISFGLLVRPPHVEYWTEARTHVSHRTGLVRAPRRADALVRASQHTGTTRCSGHRFSRSGQAAWLGLAYTATSRERPLFIACTHTPTASASAWSLVRPSGLT
jgi:hypothetical protein